MSRSFILINDNSTKLGHITNNPSSSDLTKYKKNKAICINTQSLPAKDPQNGPIFKICKPPTKCCNNPSYNKTVLNTNLHTYEDLNDITTLQLNNSNSLNFTEPIYNNYTIDPDGSLFGETPCELNNYLQFRQPLVNPYPIPQTPSNVVALVLGTYDEPFIRISWDYGNVEPGIIVVSYSIYGYDIDPDTNITTPFGPFIIDAYTYTYLLTTSTYNLQLSHSYYFEVHTNTNFATSASGTSNTVLLAYSPEPSVIDVLFTLYSYTPLTFHNLLQLSQKKYTVLITWTPSSINTGADTLSYTIHIIDNNGYNQTYIIPNTNTTSYNIPGLDEFITYTVDITANNIAGSSQSSTSSNYTVGINFSFNYKTLNTAITTTDVLDNLPFITGNGLTISNAYVNINDDDIDPNQRLVSVEIPYESITFTDNTTTTDGLSFSSLATDYYFGGIITEINILFFGTQTQPQPLNQIIPLSRAGTQFGVASTHGDVNFIFTISNSDTPYILTNTSFYNMFGKLTQFNNDISGWTVSAVSDMSYMFNGASSFNSDISGWVVSAVSDMSYMFNGASSFNSDISGWVVSAVSDMSYMFNGASSFNSDISGWVVSAVSDMSYMFNGASSFNSDISGWVVSAVSDMSYMFNGASSFNSDISGWTVSAVSDMSYMFNGATNFNNGGVDGDTTHPMTSWNVSNVSNRVGFATGSKLYDTNHLYGNIQPSYWEYVPSNPTNVSANYYAGTYDNYSVYFTWTDVVGANSYNVKLTTNSTESIISNLTNSYTFSGLSTVNTYSFSVQAVNSYGGSSGYTLATIASANVGTASATSGINSTDYINYADITLTGSNNGPFYKFTPTPNTRVSTSDANTWTTSTSTTNIVGTINNLITNFNYGFTITAYNIAGSASNTVSISNFKPVNNFMFSYITPTLPPLGTSGGDTNQQKREGIFNYLPFYYANSNAATTGKLTLSSLLYTSNQYITWSGTGPYTVTVNFPKKYTDGTTDLWTYENTGLYNNNYMAGISIDGGNSVISNYYRACQSISYVNFSSIPISNKGVCYIEQPGYSNTCNITNNSIPIILQGWPINLFTYIKPAAGSSINISNWDLSTATKSLGFSYSCNFSNVDINISNWNVINVTSVSLFRATTVKTNMPSLNWNFSKLSGLAFAESFYNSNFNSPLNFTFSGTTLFSMERMFFGASAFNQLINTTYDTNGNPIYWDVSKVNDMKRMFESASVFNQPLNSWNVSNVTTMTQMFSNASAFNQPLNSWNVSNVNDMTQMFSNASAFNQSLNSWNVSNVTNMYQMFLYCSNFNGNISSWDVRNVTNMSYLFAYASKFNQNISGWNVSKVTSMIQLFLNNYVFNQSLNLWDVSNVIDISQVFYGATNFNNGQLGYTPISGANITLSSSSYTSSPSVLTCPGATLTNGLTTSDVVIITTSSIVYAAKITVITDTALTLSPAYTSNINSGSITSITKQVQGTAPLTWNTSKATNMLQMFYNSTYFNQQLLAKDGLSPWSMSKVTNVSGMFQSTTNTNLFNNGYLITDTTHPLGWSFTATPTSTNWHTNCVLTLENAQPSPAY